MQIEVTQEHIDQSDRGESGNPVQLAVAQALGPPYTVWSDGDTIEVFDGHGDFAAYHDAPEEVRECFRTMQAGEPVQPFAFELPIEGLLKEGA